MSYRSKRTRAQVRKDDDGNATGERWGPFSSPNEVTSHTNDGRPFVKKVNVSSKAGTLEVIKDDGTVKNPSTEKVPSSKEIATHQTGARRIWIKPSTVRLQHSLSQTKASLLDKTLQGSKSVAQSSQDQTTPVMQSRNVESTIPGSHNTKLNAISSNGRHPHTIKCNPQVSSTAAHPIIVEATQNIETSSMMLGEKNSDIVKDKPSGLSNTNRLSEVTPFKPKWRTLIPDLPDDVIFDENDNVIMRAKNGKHEMISDSIQPHHIWHSKGEKYYVTFNEFYQPIKKGGHILVRFIGDVAKQEKYCLIKVTNWHHVPAQYKFDIIKLIRDHFVIPDGDVYDKGTLKRTGKSLRQYRHSLKMSFFKPDSKTKEQIYEAVPSGHLRDGWIQLVD